MKNGDKIDLMDSPCYGRDEGCKGCSNAKENCNGSKVIRELQSEEAFKCENQLFDILQFEEK